MDKDYDWIRRITSEMQRWADESFKEFAGKRNYGEALWVPRVDVYETQNAIVVRVCAAGVRPENIRITLAGDGKHLVIQGVREGDPDARNDAIRYHQLEVYTGPFERVIQLPPVGTFDQDKLSAVTRDGFFIITLPKRAEDPNEPRTVPIAIE